jgi:hypothetical protein
MSLESIKKRLQGATPEPWGTPEDGSLICGPDYDLAEVYPTPVISEHTNLRLDHEEKKRNAEFIAHARADVELLVAAVEALKKARSVELKDIWAADAALKALEDAP